SGKTIVGSPSSDNDKINFAGGTLNTRTLYASPNRLLGTGTVNTRGLLSDFDLTFDATTGLNQTVVLNSLPNQNVTLNVNALQTGPFLCYCDTMGAGYHGEGSLRIADGLSLRSSEGILGYSTNSKGTALVTGAGTKWDTLSLRVGVFGEGSLTI